MVIQSNISAMTADRQISVAAAQKDKTTEKLSSGYSINRSSDDAAGLHISEEMRHMIRGLQRGTGNIEDGISLIQTAEGALSEVQEMLHRMNELAVQSANGTNSKADRTALQEETSLLAQEIDRVGNTTTFNERELFVYPPKSVREEYYSKLPKDHVEKIQLVSSKAAEGGYLTDALQINNRWHPSAALDFSKVTQENIALLQGTGFTFYCSQACPEAFQFIFKTDGDGTGSSVEGQNNGANLHVYTVDVSNCTSGAELVNTVYDYVEANMPNRRPPGGLMDTALKVSHSNEMAKTENPNELVIYATTGYDSQERAQEQFAHSTLKYGSIDATALLSVTQTIEVKHEPINIDGYNEIRIQCNSNTKDGQYIRIARMDAEILGVDKLDLTTQDGADKAIDVISKALARISAQRSELGACQNRLEHSGRSNGNTRENLQASEARIRDTDLATEMVALTRLNILSQAGGSMLAQANQTHQGVLAMLA